MKLGKKGITLVEILLVIAIIGIIAGVSNLIFDTSMLSWTYSTDTLLVERTAKQIVNFIIEGDDKYPGIREALVITEATKTSLNVLPLWRDTFEYKGDLQRFYLTKHLAQDSQIPICWVKSLNDKDFIVRFIELRFDTYRHQHYVNVLGDLLPGSIVKLAYKANPDVNPEVYMRLYYNDNTRTLMRQYALTSKAMVADIEKVDINFCEFSYYTNTGELIVFDGDSIPLGKLQNISGISIRIKTKRNSEQFELFSFAALRNLKNLTGGLILTEGYRVKIPDSYGIKGLIIDNISGIQENGKIILGIGYDQEPSWLLDMDLGVIQGDPFITNYRIEFPSGANVYSSGLVKMDLLKGINLLTLDRNGLYDYDDDSGLTDRVIFKGDNVFLKVLQLDVDSATLYFRP
ncbi:MAG: prepilin-type N-terminal cleavage/methylation domain-containing protein [Candidatus Gygaella obscura]|nr:prepilin-type N-terminal cleavage/methylation domain-containing protein [Candidatus Gygaella obscura]